MFVSIFLCAHWNRLIADIIYKHYVRECIRVYAPIEMVSILFSSILLLYDFPDFFLWLGFVSQINYSCNNIRLRSGARLQHMNTCKYDGLRLLLLLRLYEVFDLTRNNFNAFLTSERTVKISLFIHRLMWTVGSKMLKRFNTFGGAMWIPIFPLAPQFDSFRSGARNASCTTILQPERSTTFHHLHFLMRKSDGISAILNASYHIHAYCLSQDVEKV